MTRISELYARDNETNEISTSILFLAVCLPDACYPSDFYKSLGVDLVCQTKNEARTLDAGDIAFL